MNISENFTRDEFLHSNTADRMGYPIQIDKYVLENLTRLVETCLQPARDNIGKPFVVTSGYRPPWLNRAVGGSDDSRHMYGCAVDFKVPDTDHLQVYNRLKELDLPIDQLILEPGWIHLGIALPGETPREQYWIVE